MKSTLDTLILLSCPCGRVMASRQERKDGLCRECANASVCIDVEPNVLAAYAMATVHGTGLGENIEAMTATVNAWNACTDKEAFLKQ